VEAQMEVERLEQEAEEDDQDAASNSDDGFGSGND